jgi:undecaprenyl-diphosphatase
MAGASGRRCLRDEPGTIPAHMRDEITASVTPGGRPAPLGARGDETHDGVGPRTDPRRIDAPDIWRVAASTRLLLAALAGALLLYAAIATDVVHDGPLSEFDVDVATWVAASMPSWAEWVARPFTWLGGAVGAALVVGAATLLLLARRARLEAALLVVVILGTQVLVFTGKDGYGRPRPDVGSAIALPSSASFPSGHAATGTAVFGLLAILVATAARTRAERVLAVSAGVGLALAIGASRVVLNVHYVTDVLAGWSLGVAWMATCLLALRLLVRRGG